MEGATYNSMDKLYQLLRKFLPENGQDDECDAEDGDARGQEEKDAARGGAAKEHIQASCSYCGASVAHMSMDAAGSQDCICPLCKEELIRQKDLFYQTVDETIRNVKYMFSILWDKRIQVEKCNKLEKPAPKAAEGRKKKKDASTWTVSLEPRFMQAEMDDSQKICIFKIRTAIPSGVVAALVAYTAIYDYLHLVAEEEHLDQKRMAGLAYWYMVHYLRCVDYERYIRHYDRAAEQLVQGAGTELYRELRRERRSRAGDIFSVPQDLARACRQEKEQSTTDAPVDPHQENSKAASDS